VAKQMSRSLVEARQSFSRESLKNPNKARTKPVMGKILKASKTCPISPADPSTFDRGSEFVSWPQLQAKKLVKHKLVSAIPSHPLAKRNG